jgi:hypothetical protein
MLFDSRVISEVVQPFWAALRRGERGVRCAQGGGGYPACRPGSAIRGSHGPLKLLVAHRGIAWLQCDAIGGVVMGLCREL